MELVSGGSIKDLLDMFTNNSNENNPKGGFDE